MLSNTDKEFIFANAHASEHDYLLYSLMYGDPFLIEGCLCFFDGQHLTVEGSHLLKEHIDNARFSKIVCARPEFAQAKSIWYWGPDHLSLDVVDGMRGIEHATPSEKDVDQFIKLDEWCLDELPKVRKAIRRAERSGLTVTSSIKDKVLTWEHFGLMRHFMAGHSVELTDTMYNSAVRPLLCCPSIRMINVHNSVGTLVGFGLINEMFPDMHIFLLSFYNHDFPGADMLWWEVIETAKSRGVSRLHVGYSLGNEGVYNFKMKWGAQHSGKPYYFIGYYDSAMTCDIDQQYFTFWERLIGDPLLTRCAAKN